MYKHISYFKSLEMLIIFNNGFVYYGFVTMIIVCG